MEQISWPVLTFYGGQTVVILIVLIFGIIKILPTWKVIKLKQLELRKEEFELRKAESEVKGQEAAALVQLGTGLAKMSETLDHIAIEQRRATEIIEILQRANADQSDQLTYSVRALTEGMTRLTERVDRIEGQYVQAERTREGTR